MPKVYDQPGFLGVGDAAGMGTFFGLVGVVEEVIIRALGGVDPSQRGVEWGDEAVDHLGCRFEEAVVEPL